MTWSMTDIQPYKSWIPLMSSIELVYRLCMELSVQWSHKVSILLCTEDFGFTREVNWYHQKGSVTPGVGNVWYRVYLILPRRKGCKDWIRDKGKQDLNRRETTLNGSGNGFSSYILKHDIFYESLLIIISLRTTCI